MKKPHDFAFSAAPNLGVYVCHHVSKHEHPILHVVHDSDGDWQFLCGGDHSQGSDADLLCLEHVVAGDPSLNQLAEMGCNHSAARDSADSPWVITEDSGLDDESPENDHEFANAPPLYCALLEVRPLPGCELDPSEHAGAFVRCYVVANEEAEAKQRIEAALIEDRYELVDVDWCVDVDEWEWENPDDPEATALEAEARKTGDVVYGEFDTWPPDAPDVVN